MIKQVVFDSQLAVLQYTCGVCNPQIFNRSIDSISQYNPGQLPCNININIQYYIESMIKIDAAPLFKNLPSHHSFLLARDFIASLCFDTDIHLRQECFCAFVSVASYFQKQLATLNLMQASAVPFDLTVVMTLPEMMRTRLVSDGSNLLYEGAYGTAVFTPTDRLVASHFSFERTLSEMSSAFKSLERADFNKLAQLSETKQRFVSTLWQAADSNNYFIGGIK